jgi:hypothetical protein
MWLNELSKRWLAWRVAGAECSKPRRQTSRPRSLRLALEQLETRTLLSNYSAATVADLIADINAANLAGGSNTIALTAPTTSPYILAAVDNTTDGATGLPVIAAKDNLLILGNGDAIARSAGTPAFRLLDVAGRASLTLENLTLQGGLAFGSGVSAEGGAIFNDGTLTLNGVTVRNNIAQGQNGAKGQAGQSAAGGGIYSSASVTLEGGTLIQNNQALGGAGNYLSGPGGNGLGGGLYVSSGSLSLTNFTLSSNSAQGGPGGFYFLFSFFQGNGGPGGYGGGHTYYSGGAGGNGFGGGLYVTSGSVSLTNLALFSNTAQGGNGGIFGGTYASIDGAGGNGFGGGLYAAGGSVTLQSDSVTGNAANGGLGGGFPSGLGEGGGLYFVSQAKAYLDAFTVANVINNTASTSDANIYGHYRS